MPDIRLQRGDGNLGLRGIDTPDNEPDRAVSVAYLEAHTSGNSAHPFNEWVSGTDYAVGDQVLYGIDDPDADLRGVYSIYIRIALTQEQIDAGVTVNNTTPPEVSGTTAGWRLLRSGIVSLSTNDGAGAAGLTSNSTLRINHGAGIDVNRSATTYTISTHSTSSSDVNDFMPGWAYSYFNLIDNTTHTGTVGVRQTGFEIDAVENIDGNVYLHIDFQDPNSFDPGDHFAFRTFDGNTRTQLFRAGATADRIIYAIQDSNPELVLIAAVDAPVSTLGELRTLFNVPSGTRSITPISFQNLFTLDEHHSGQTGTAPWAQTGNDTNIPTDKLGGLSSDVLAPNTVFTINDAWLPDDIIRSTTTNVITRNAVDDTTTGESLVVAADGVATLTLDHQPDVVNDLSDVNFTQPTETPVVEGLLWDATEMEWINSPVTQTLEGLTDTAVPTPGNEQYLRYSTERGNDAQGDPLPPAWVAVDLPQMASGRIEFTQGTGAAVDEYTATGFIENPAEPTNVTPIDHADFTTGVNQQLRFTLARAANLALNVLDFGPLPWDQPFADLPVAQRSLTFSSTTDSLYPGQELENLESGNSNILISPDSGEGPWTVSFTDPSLILSSAASGELDGGNFPQSTFDAVNNATAAPAVQRMAAGVTWGNAGIDIDNGRFGGQQSFLDPIVGYRWSFHVNNISVNRNARWLATPATINGGATTTVDDIPNTAGQSGTIGQAGTVDVVVTDYTAYNNVTVPADTVSVRFERPAGVTGTTYMHTLVSIPVNDQPTWLYPVIWIVSDSNTTIPDFVTNGNDVLPSTSKTRTIPSLTTIDVAANAVGEGTRYVWVAYTAGSPTITSIDVRTRRGTADATNPITLSTAQQSSTNLSFQPTGGPAVSAEPYKWFWIEVPEQDRVTLGAVST